MILSLALPLLLAQKSAKPVSDDSFIESTYFPAVTLLYAQDEGGAMKMRCTATAFEKVENGYLFSTAAHCAVVEDDDESSMPDKVENTAFFITPDEAAEVKTFIRTTVVACGYQAKGDDFCVFFAKTSQDFPVVPIGEDSIGVAGEEVVNVASPEGLGKQVFYGRITSPRVDRAIAVNKINWTHTVLLQLPGTNGGSSGSSVVCLKQHAVCAFLVGNIGGTTIVAIPVSRFKTFVNDVKTCKEKKYIVDTNADDSEFSYHCPAPKDSSE